MRHVDPGFPVFLLMGLLVGEAYYARTLVPRVKQLKQGHLANPDSPLHSRDIRRCQGEFAFLATSVDRKAAFYNAINEVFTTSRIRLFAVAIDKERLLRHSLLPLNPYNVSLSQLLSTVCGPPRVVGPSRPTVARIVAESRGRAEDKDLQNEYQELRRRGLETYGALDVQARRPGTVQHLFPARIDFARKSRSICGLELADLAAYPVARAAMASDWSNPSAQIVLRKLKSLVHFP